MFKKIILIIQNLFYKNNDYPNASNPKKVGSFDIICKSGGGYFYDEILEYRVWIYPKGKDVFFYAFSTYKEALKYSKVAKYSEKPLVLVLQKEFINEPEPGNFIHIKEKRITEWQVQWLQGNKRKKNSILVFLKSHK